MSFEVKPIPSEDKPRDKRLDRMKHKDSLPKLPANIMCLGRAGAGKSSCVYSMLNDGYVVKGKSVFDEIVVYLGTLDSVDSFKSLPSKNIVILHEFVPEEFEQYLEDLKEHQMERLEKGKAPLNVAIIFDDFVGMGLLRHVGGKSSPLERLCLTSRHECNATIIFCSQAYKNNGLSNPTIRNNITHYIIYSMGRSDMCKIAEDHCGHLTEKEFLEMYDEINRKPHNFLMINYKKPDHERMTEGFTKPAGRKMLAVVRDESGSEAEEPAD
jgi:hypothetical protein